MSFTQKDIVKFRPVLKKVSKTVITIRYQLRIQQFRMFRKSTEKVIQLSCFELSRILTAPRRKLGLKFLQLQERFASLFRNKIFNQSQIQVYLLAASKRRAKISTILFQNFIIIFISYLTLLEL